MKPATALADYVEVASREVGDDETAAADSYVFGKFYVRVVLVATAEGRRGANH